MRFLPMELRELQIDSSRLYCWTLNYSIATPFPSIKKVLKTSGTTQEQEDFYLDRITLLDSLLVEVLTLCT
jgi:hypothetical protein